MHILHTQLKRSQKGFSLVEMLVALSIFAIIMVASTGSLLTLIDVNAKAQALYTTTTNLSFALDSITREMRMGYRYYCDNNPDNLPTQNLPASGTNHNCPSGDNRISFTREKDGVQIGYRLNTADHTIEQKIDAGKWMSVTSKDEIHITKFKVVVENSQPYCLVQACRPIIVPAETADDNQPIVILEVAGYVNNGLDTNTDFNIQTRIAQRRLDLK